MGTLNPTHSLTHLFTQCPCICDAQTTAPADDPGLMSAEGSVAGREPGPATHQFPAGHR